MAMKDSIAVEVIGQRLADRLGLVQDAWADLSRVAAETPLTLLEEKSRRHADQVDLGEAPDVRSALLYKRSVPTNIRRLCTNVRH